MTFEEEKDEPEEDPKETKKGKGKSGKKSKKKEEVDPEELERREQAARLQAEIQKYGVSPLPLVLLLSSANGCGRTSCPRARRPRKSCWRARA